MGTLALNVVGEGVRSAVGTRTRCGLGSAVGTLVMMKGVKVRCGDANGIGGSGPLWGRVIRMRSAVGTRTVFDGKTENALPHVEEILTGERLGHEIPYVA